MKIYSAINAVMSEVGGITKSRQNQAQGYKFRGIDDVYLAVQPLFVKHKVFMVPRVIDSKSETKETTQGKALLYRILTIEYDFISAEDGSKVTAVVVGESMDSGDKASNKAMSVAHKYAILQVFAVPTEEPKDPENDSYEIARGRKDKPHDKVAPASQEPVKPHRGFDVDNHTQRKWLAQKCYDAGLTDEQSTKALASMAGRSARDVETIISGVKNELPI